MSKFYNKKLIISGNVVELYNYETPVIQSDEKKRVGRAGQATTSKEIQKQNREKTAYRARQKVRRFANVNFDCNSKFITLTFEKNITDLSYANSEFTKFIKRLSRKLHMSIEYIAVIEFQERGAIHYHLLMNVPYIPNAELNSIWSHGFVKINKIDNVDNIGAYVTKYMTKDSIDERLKGRKCYFMSRNLKKPKVITNNDLIDEVCSDMEIKRVAFSSTYETDYYGVVEYMQFVLCKPVDISEYERLLHLRRAGATIDKFDKAVKQTRRQGYLPCTTTI